MKSTLILILVLLPTLVFAAKPKGRKVSNSRYFICTLERDAVDKKFFKKEYHFPFPTEEGESYELKGSMRWNQFKIVFHQSGDVKIDISERIQGSEVSESKILKLGKDAQFESFKTQVDLKSQDTVIPYFINCIPE